MIEKTKCIICGVDQIDSQYDIDSDMRFFTCPNCGRYEFSEDDLLNNKINKEGLASYFFYNGFKMERGLDKTTEYRFFTTRSKEECDEYNKKADEKGLPHGRPVHFDDEIVKLWWPKSLSEKVDLILLKLNSLTDYIGQEIQLSFEELIACLFIKKQKSKFHIFSEEDLLTQINYILNYLKDSEYIYWSCGDNKVKDSIIIRSRGYERIDILEKNNADGRLVLVAMSFAEGTEKLREAIRSGILNAGYHAVFIDEVEHNEFITPELLSYIRRSRFVVVDLTHNNNGAYFEEGYAMGLGKPVIQLCKNGVRMHFDIAQKNTIMWKDEDDIPLRLTNRIKATIE